MTGRSNQPQDWAPVYGIDPADAEWWARRPSAPVVHHDHECERLERTANTIPVDPDVDPRDDAAPQRACKVCTPGVGYGPQLGPQNRYRCRVCGGERDSDGTCSWCEQFDEVAMLD